MKIDTSKLTAVQAQQIQAIASGIHFTLTHYTGQSMFDSPLAISTTQIQDRAHYDTLIAAHQSVLAKIEPTDTKTIESQQRHIAMLERRREGIAEWLCEYTVRSERYYHLSAAWKHNSGQSLMAKINATLATQYGLTDLNDAPWMYPSTDTMLESWQEVQQWYDRHSALDHEAIVATVDSIVAEHMASLPFRERLALRLEPVRHIGLIPRIRMRMAWRKMKADLTNLLDTLRPKA